MLLMFVLSRWCAIHHFRFNQYCWLQSDTVNPRQCEGPLSMCCKYVCGYWL